MSTGPLVVVGDCLLDIDLEGHAGRLCPDAPAPVLDGLVEHARPGGAGLAAWLAARDGLDVVLVTALGHDAAASRVRDLLRGVRLVELRRDGPTPVKRRVRAGGQTLLRLDEDDAASEVGAITREAEQALRSAGSVLVSDYGRGVASRAREVLASVAHRVPVVWDPHTRGGPPVPGAALVTPNASEAAVLADDAGTDLRAAARHAATLVETWQVGAVTVTLGPGGALLSWGRGAPVLVPGERVHATDVCGAGDRFSVSAAAALRRGDLTSEAVREAVGCATAYVAAGGAAGLHDPLPPAADHQPGVVDRVRARGGTVVATGGCFDLLHPGHVSTLQAARALGDCLVVCVNGDASVARLKGPERPIVHVTDRVRVLEALSCVDEVVVFEEDTPIEALRRVRPDIWAKGGDYAGIEVPEQDVVAGWGGQVVSLPYVAGHSTTRLVEAATTTEEVSS